MGKGICYQLFLSLQPSLWLEQSFSTQVLLIWLHLSCAEQMTVGPLRNSSIYSSLLSSPLQNHSSTEWYFEGWPIHCIICSPSNPIFPSELGEGLNCGVAILSELLRCLSDISSFICPGQKGRERNGVARSDPARNAGLSGAYMCECVINAECCMRQHIRTWEWICVCSKIQSLYLWRYKTSD